MQIKAILQCKKIAQEGKRGEQRERAVGAAAGGGGGRAVYNVAGLRGI